MPCSFPHCLRPSSAADARLNDQEWKTTIAALAAIKRANEYKDSTGELFQGRYSEAEKLSDNADAVLREHHPALARQLPECARQVGKYREAVAYLRSTERLEQALEAGNADPGLPYYKPNHAPEEKQKAKIEIIDRQIGACITALDAVL